MYPAPFDYHAPATIEEALQLLQRYGEDAKILAGGQSLMPMMKLRIASPSCLIDINRIPGLDGVRQEGDRLVFGALCRHAEVAASPLVRQHLPLMTDAASVTADVQVRNRGTVTGSLAHADPAGDWPAALSALDTHVTIAGPSGRRTLSLDAFIVDAYTTALEPTEMLVAVSVTIPPGPGGGSYVKFEKRAGDFAVASVGVQIRLDDDRCGKVAISLGAVGPMPIRAREAEALLTGAVPDEGRIAEAASLVRGAAQPFDDTRGSEEYKRHIAGVLFTRALAVALNRARGMEVPAPHP